MSQRDIRRGQRDWPLTDQPGKHALNDMLSEHGPVNVFSVRSKLSFKIDFPIFVASKAAPW